MNDDTIQDLKQFISATVSQQTDDLKQDISGIKQDISGLKQDIAKLDTKVDSLSAFVTEAIDNFDESTQIELKNHNKRITRLEQKTA